MEYEKPDHDKPWFLNELEKRSGVNQKDIRKVIKSFEDILSDIAKKRETLIVSGFFRFSVTKIPDHERWNEVKKVRFFKRNMYRIRFKLSPTFLKGIKEYQEEVGNIEVE